MSAPISISQARHLIEMIDNFNAVVQSVGGSGWTDQEIMKDKFFDVIDHLAPNGVRFCTTDDLRAVEALKKMITRFGWSEKSPYNAVVCMANEIELLQKEVAKLKTSADPYLKDY